MGPIFNANSKRCFAVALVHEGATPEEAAKHLSGSADCFDLSPKTS